MKTRPIIIVFSALLTFAAASIWPHRPSVAATPYGGPFSNQPIALSWDDSKIAVCNPEAGTVSIFSVAGDKNTKVTEITVGKEPSGVAWSPDGTNLYVANQADGTVEVIAQASVGVYQSNTTITVGTEPHGMVLSASGRKLYVTNTRSNNVSVIDITTNKVTATISNVGPEPRGIAITHPAGATDSNQVVYVTDFLALPSTNGHPDGFDDAKAGFVTAISVATDTVIGTITLGPVADTGFKAAGDALKHIAAPATPVATDFTFTTGAYPNQLANIATHGNFAYIPNTAASPNGPVRFNVNMQSLLSVIDVRTNKDAGQTINMQSAVNAQTNPTKLFITQPWAIAFKNSADTAYVASAASNIVVKLTVDANGKATVQNDPSDATRVFEIPVGKNPRGIVINSTDTRAYVWNYISRDVSVIDLTQTAEKVVATLVSSAQPTAGTLADKIHVGRELFFSSVGTFDPPAAGQPAITGRMSNNGWGSCGACHPFGLTDNVVWIFASGPRRTIPLHSTFLAGDPTQQRALNWSAIFDEIAAFEGNIRNVSGGLGMFVQADGITQTPAVPSFTLAAAGQKQLTVRGVGGWDAITAYVQNGIRPPLSPASKTDPDIAAGRTLFTQANCQSCHGTGLWTTSRVRFTPTPDPSLVQNTELIGELRPVGTFDPTALNEVRATAAAPLGVDGFNPPSLLSLFAFPQTFFHGGSSNTLDDVLANVAHRSSGSGTDTLTSASARAQLVKFLNSIDGTTTAINPPASQVNTGGIVNAASGVLGAKGVAPGSIAGVYGTGLSLVLQLAAAVPLPKSIGGATFNVGPAAAAFFYAAPTQLNVQIPWDAPLGTVTATSTVGSSTSTTQANVVQFSPGIFTTNAGGSGQGIIVGTLTNLIAAPVGAFPGSQPVNPGDIITVYCTGLGLVANQPATGAVAGASPLPQTPVQATATIGGLPAAVGYSGLTPGGVGLYQVNATVPSGVTPGSAVTVTISIGGVVSNSVTMAVAAPAGHAR